MSEELKPIKIVAMVQFNDHCAFVLNRMPEFKYQYLEGNQSILYAEDGGFYSVFKYDRPSGNWQAFAGREFDLPLIDGGVVKCKGQWWGDGMSLVTEKLNLEFSSVTYSTVDRLRDCYVFTGASIESGALNKMYEDYKGTHKFPAVYPYWDYEKAIKYEKLFKEHCEDSHKLKLMGTKPEILLEKERKYHEGRKLLHEFVGLSEGLIDENILYCAKYGTVTRKGEACSDIVCEDCKNSFCAEDGFQKLAVAYNKLTEKRKI